MTVQLSPSLSPRPPRIALYSHDTQGLGHVRRNLAIAGAIVAAVPSAEILVLTGTPEAAALPLPERTDVVTLPTVAKDSSGRYRSRVHGTPVERTVELRSRIAVAALSGFQPDLLIVDKVPLGFGAELEPALRDLRHRGDTRLVLGLREILDEPAVARREWDEMGSTEAVVELYDEVWVYGDATVYDLVAEYDLPDQVAAKVRYTGYLSRGRTGAGPRHPSSAPPPRPYVLCMVGGGQDGFSIAERFVRTAMPVGHRGVVLTGPFMRPEQRSALERLSAANPGVEVVDFVPNPEVFVAQARAVVSMAGYNSTCELLAQECPTLLVPRVSPRAEQLVRAERLSGCGLVDMLAPDQLTVEALSGWIRRAVRAPRRSRRSIDLDGLAAIGARVQRIYGGVRRAA